MLVQRLESTDAFIVFDLDDAPTSVGVTRLAPKVLVDGAVLLARSITYTFALFGLRYGGASAGINAKPDQRDAAVGAYVTEVAPLVAERRWLTEPSLGLTEDDLAPLRADDPRPATLWADGVGRDLLARGAVAAAESVAGPLAARRAGVMGGGAIAKAITAAVTAAGATVADGETTEVDVLFVGGKVGSIDHDAAAEVRAAVVVPVAPVPVTAKAFAVLSRAGSVYVPDFVSTAAPLLAGLDPEGGDPVERVRSATGELTAGGGVPWRTAVERAETFLSTWQDPLPFGRPLA